MLCNVVAFIYEVLVNSDIVYSSIISYLSMFVLTVYFSMFSDLSGHLVVSHDIYRQTDTTVFHLALSPEPEGGQINSYYNTHIYIYIYVCVICYTVLSYECMYSI